MKLITPFMERLHSDLKTKREVSDTTASLYLKNLMNLNNSIPFNNLAFLKQKETMDSRLAEYADSTRKSVLGGVVSVLSLVKDKAAYKALHRYYADKLDAMNKADREKDTTQKSERQEKNWMSWESIQEVKKELEKKVAEIKPKKQITAQDFDTLLEAVVLALYTDIPPRRNQDYQVMMVSKKYGDKNVADVNWLDLTGKKFVFNVYKTAKTHGQQSVAIPDSLMELLKVYLKHHPGAGNKDFRFLVYSDGSPLTAVNAITRILNRVFGKNVGTTMLRHIYLSDKYDIKEMKEDAEAMGHTLEVQKEYMKGKE